MTSKMGIVLRELRGAAGVGEGPIEVLTRVKDFNVITVQGPQGEMPAPADSLVAFTAMTFRELVDPDDCDPGASGADVWEFRVQAPVAEGAPPAMARMYVGGDDIFSIRAMSKVIS